MIRQQSASTVYMVKPSMFYGNAETAATNFFQKDSGDNTSSEKALAEFDEVVFKIRALGIRVIVLHVPSMDTPDAIFPNNIVSFHAEGRIIYYPMYAPSRRRERSLGISPEITAHFDISTTSDFTFQEKNNLFLEGTGSIVFDHVHAKAYASLSARTSPKLLDEICDLLSYSPILFHSVDAKQQAIYHTNVVMSIGSGFVVVCNDAITDTEERKRIVDHFRTDELEIIKISLEQMECFCANLLEVKNQQDEKHILLSETSLAAFTPTQIKRLSIYGKIVSFNIPTIEALGGGSIRCMLAELFLPKKNHG